jgi:hypothetical protein
MLCLDSSFESCGCTLLDGIIAVASAWPWQREAALTCFAFQLALSAGLAASREQQWLTRLALKIDCLDARILGCANSCRSNRIKWQALAAYAVQAGRAVHGLMLHTED